MAKDSLVGRKAGRDIVWIKTCMVCVRDKGLVISFNTKYNKDNSRETYEEHMAEHELTGKAAAE